MKRPNSLSPPLRAFTLVEILIALTVVAVALIPLFGVMSAGNRSSSQGEALVQASALCRNIMDTLLNDVPFKSLLPGGRTYVDAKQNLFTVANANAMKSGSLNTSTLNKAIGNGDGTIFNTNPGSGNAMIVDASGSPISKYWDGLLHATSTPAFAYKDERGNYYYVNVCVRVVPVLFRYLGADSNSDQSGNVGNSGNKCWRMFYGPDYTISNAVDYVFGDENISTAAGPLNAWYPGDVPDSRLKKIVVSIFWVDRGRGGKDAKPQSFSLIAFKAKLED